MKNLKQSKGKLEWRNRAVVVVVVLRSYRTRWHGAEASEHYTRADW